MSTKAERRQQRKAEEDQRELELKAYRQANSLPASPIALGSILERRLFESNNE